MGKKSGAHSIHRLTALAVQRSKTPGRYADGGGLYLQVADSGSKSWLFRYMIRGRSREMGLGPLRDVTLEAARKEASAARQLLIDGVDPLERRRTERSAVLARQERTWEWCCNTYVTEVKEPELTNPKHAAQWGSTLKTYTYPQLGPRPIDSIAMNDVHAVLAPIWLVKNETASRVRQRMEAVFAWAKVAGYRIGDNPATWKGGLDHMLPKPSKVQGDEHHPALPFALVPSFFVELMRLRDVARKYGRSLASSYALEFLILTAQRTNPVILATWGEIDFERKVWESPAEKMKMSHPHRTPLSTRAIELLRELTVGKADELIFGKLHSTSLLNVVQNMHERDPRWVDPKQESRRVTPHGFRSSFRDWAAETTDYENEVCELALAHSKGNKTEAAYRRADMLEKRRPLMQQWADYCCMLT